MVRTSQPRVTRCGGITTKVSYRTEQKTTNPNLNNYYEEINPYPGRDAPRVQPVGSATGRFIVAIPS